mmetsp:Transcript_41956/g.116840  ORF Transcript_41956/g.116840 Transcript_41956/m.116840 type:complete len:244 (-) Transcript_41956:154-885(-)
MSCHECLSSVRTRSSLSSISRASCCTAEDAISASRRHSLRTLQSRSACAFSTRVTWYCSWSVDTLAFSCSLCAVCHGSSRSESAGSEAAYTNWHNELALALAPQPQTVDWRESSQHADLEAWSSRSAMRTCACRPSPCSRNASTSRRKDSISLRCHSAWETRTASTPPPPAMRSARKQQSAAPWPWAHPLPAPAPPSSACAAGQETSTRPPGGTSRRATHCWPVCASSAEPLHTRELWRGRES